MENVISTIIYCLPALVGAVATVIVTVLSVKNKGVKGVNLNNVVNNLLQMLPNLINLTELTNSQKTGVEKKAFLMNYISGLISIMGAKVDDNTMEYISHHIDNIITLTKQMHTEGVTNDLDENF